MRLIDADDALKWAREYMRSEERGLIEEFFRDCPTISPESLWERGRWEKHLFPLAFKCSCCWYTPSAAAWRYHERKFCPNCGARMDLEG